jgi:hypothetical protein
MTPLIARLERRLALAEKRHDHIGIIGLRAQIRAAG